MPTDRTSAQPRVASAARSGRSTGRGAGAAATSRSTTTPTSPTEAPLGSAAEPAGRQQSAIETTPPPPSNTRPVTERAAYIGRVRALARGVAQAYYESREKLGFPMLSQNAKAA